MCSIFRIYVLFISLFLIQLCPGRVLVLFVVLIYGLFLVFRVYILFLVPFYSNLALFIVYSYSVLIFSVYILVQWLRVTLFWGFSLFLILYQFCFYSQDFSPVFSSSSICGLIDIFKFLFRKKGLHGLNIILVTQLIKV